MLFLRRPRMLSRLVLSTILFICLSGFSKKNVFQILQFFFVLISFLVLVSYLIIVFQATFFFSHFFFHFFNLLENRLCSSRTSFFFQQMFLKFYFFLFFLLSNVKRFRKSLYFTKCFFLFQSWFFIIFYAFLET